MRLKTRFRFNFTHVILLSFVAIRILLSLFCEPFILNEIVNPIFWVAMTVLLYFYTRNRHGHFTDLKTNCKTMVIILLLYIIVNIVLGIMFGFAYSPYSQNFLPIIRNIWRVIIPIIGIEYARSYIVNYCPRNRLYIFLEILIFSAFEISFSTLFNGFATPKDCFVYILSTVAPIVFANIAFTLLTWYGSYKLVLIFRAPVAALRILLPILPGLDWFMTGVRDSATPAMIGLYYYQTLRDVDKTDGRVRRRKSFIAYIPIIIVFTFAVLFVANAFSYRPVAVLSNSMKPEFERGDLIIYHELDEEGLKALTANDIILYKRDGQIIAHRIEEKYKDLGELYFIAKGDSNNASDDKPVHSSQVLGKYVSHVKYIGYPSVFLYELFNKGTAATVETGEVK